MEIPHGDIPDKDPEDLDFEDLDEMGIQAGFFMLGQIRAHEVATGVNVTQICAACGIAPTKANFPAIVDAVWQKCMRVEREERGDSSFMRLLKDAPVEDLGPAVFSYTNGLHGAMGQLAKILAMNHLKEVNGNG